MEGGGRDGGAAARWHNHRQMDATKLARCPNGVECDAMQHVDTT